MYWEPEYSAEDYVEKYAEYMNALQNLSKKDRQKLESKMAPVLHSIWVSLSEKDQILVNACLDLGYRKRCEVTKYRSVLNFAKKSKAHITDQLKMRINDMESIDEIAEDVLRTKKIIDNLKIPKGF